MDIFLWTVTSHDVKYIAYIILIWYHIPHNGKNKQRMMLFVDYVKYRYSFGGNTYIQYYNVPNK